ncbi:hypothetical protein [Salinibacter ruber]|uniref:phage terminase large subunit family protein n=1 Tax=Salinibacter ruber TaxID=146919 RepID=UPI002168C5F1|nr:hypothetical protein [Salinibacter ruber]
MVEGVASQAGVKTASDEGEDAPEQWEEWLEALFPAYVGEPFGDRHKRFWNWLWDIGPNESPRPYVGIYPRGGGKSTTAELATCALGLRDVCDYAVYVQKTQSDANDAISNIQKLIESAQVERYYPAHSKPEVGKYGNTRGWSMERLRTEGGFAVDALGLNSAFRGAKVDESRPDLVILDDIDHKHDSADMTRKKLQTIKDSIMQAVSDTGSVVIGMQNLIHPNGIFARLEDGRADFLQRRIVDGPHPAVEDLETERQKDEGTGNYRDVIVGGTPTWEGQDLEDCQTRINESGLDSFIRECQNEVKEREGALWSSACLSAVRVGPEETPEFQRIVVGVDPAGGTDEVGIVVAGLSFSGTAYVLDDRSVDSAVGPNRWGQIVRDAYDYWRADAVLGETNYGGTMIKNTVQGTAGQTVNFNEVTATRGKQVRAEPVAALYGGSDVGFEDSQVKHAGSFHALEKQMTSWVPGDSDSPDRLDALVWALTDLLIESNNRSPSLIV